MITRFTARNYKNLDAELECSQINILVGPNNSGKSNFIRAIGFLSDMLGSVAAEGQRFIETVQLHGGVGLKKGGQEKEIELKWQTDHKKSGYSIAFNAGGLLGDTPEIISEAVRWEGQDISVERMGQSALSGISSLSKRETFYKFFGKRLKQTDHSAVCTALKAGFHSYRFGEFRPSELAAPSPVDGSEGVLAKDGRNLNQVVRWIEKAPGDRLERLTWRMQTLIPGLKRMLTQDEAGTHWWTEFRTAQGSYALNQFSDGTVFALALAVLLLPPPSVKIICIDEPERQLHPVWLKIIATWIQQLPKEKQLFFSTHSSELLDALTENFFNGSLKVHLFPGPGPEHGCIKTLVPGAYKEQEGWKLGDLYRGEVEVPVEKADRGPG
jgi:predicted ATPase